MSTRQLTRPESEQLTLPGARIVILRGPDKGHALALDKEQVVVGTGPSAELKLTDPTVSHAHLSLRMTAEGVLLTDLDSTNGTFVDDRRVRSIYLKPGDRIELGDTRLRLERTRASLQVPLSRAHAFGELLGQSVAARRLFATLEQIAPTDATILLEGETGTGKEVTVRSIHHKSPRAERPLVTIDCGSLPAGLIESELFGHEKGAFTGADRATRGAFRTADGGTLFLDEIGELPLALQPKLLRALERREVWPVGGTAHVPVNIRIVAATNRDLRQLVSNGLFREDLYYRLNVVSLRLPPLRERLDDVPLLAARFWQELGGNTLPDEILAPLLTHTWPGNVRELRNRIERAYVLDQPAELSRSGDETPKHEPFGTAKDRVIFEFERTYLAALVQRAHGNQSEAARLASLDRAHLVRLLKKHGLHQPRGA